MAEIDSQTLAELIRVTTQCDTEVRRMQIQLIDFTQRLEECENRIAQLMYLVEIEKKRKNC